MWGHFGAEVNAWVMTTAQTTARPKGSASAGVQQSNGQAAVGAATGEGIRERCERILNCDDMYENS